MTVTRVALAAATVAALAAFPLRGEEPGGRVTSCDARQMRFDDGETLRGEQTLDVPGGELAVEAPENGAVRLQGGAGSGFHVLACKALAAGEGASLASIVASVENGRLVVRGPDGARWGVQLVVDVPRGARVSVAAENGPVSVVDVSASVRIDVVNGPVSALRAEGALDVSAENGPVSLVDAAGDVKVDAQNGPLTVKLAPGGWRGAGLDARTENGPVSLRLPEPYDSGVEVTMSRRTPLTCSVAGCDEARQETAGGRRTLALGGSRPSVRLSTTNGPVSIKTRT